MLPPFPKAPRTRLVRQLECARCREIFIIAEDAPTRFNPRTDSWQVPQDQYPKTSLRYDEDKSQVGVKPEIHSEPTERVRASRDWGANHYLNCPRCGADNRNWLSVSTGIRPLRAPHIIAGSILSLLLLVIILASRWDELFQDRLLAMICLVLAVALPLLLVPGQWRALREHQLVQRFLPNVTQRQLAPTVRTVASLYILLIIILPGMRYGFVPVLRQTLSTTLDGSDNSNSDIAKETDFLAEWLYLGTLTSIVSSAFALLGVGQVLAGVNNKLPRPIYANTANMVRVTLWEAKRALEINDFFERIQWTLTKRNQLGGIDMEGFFRDPPEILANGKLEELVRVQKYLISTDRWCVITSARILDTKSQRPAGGAYSDVPLFSSVSKPAVSVGRPKD